MKILVLGCSGQIGRCLYDQLENSKNEVVYTSRDQIDISKFKTTKKKILEISPDVIINAAAYTAVDMAEEDQENAELINHLAVANISDICTQLDSWLIHISTDYVFDGCSKAPYKEDDKTSPQSVYGQTKLKGELAIQSSGCKHIIIRTAWVFSEYGKNFLKTIMRLGLNQNEISIIADQIGCPTYAQDIAICIKQIVPQLIFQKSSGVYHYCGYQSCSWYEFACVISEELNSKNLRYPSIINSIETSAYPTLARRPKYSVLDCSKIKNNFNVSTSNWHDGVIQVISKI